MLDDADDRVRDAADAQLAADRAQPVEEVLRHLVAHEDDRHTQLRFLRGEYAAIGEIELLDREVVTLDGVGLDVPRPRVLARGAEVLLALDGVPRPTGKRIAKDRDVAVKDARAPLPLTPLVLGNVVAEPREAAEREGVRAEHAAGEVLLDVLAHPRDDRDDRDEEHHADHHAQQREEALELLHADLLEREPHGLVEGHDPPGRLGYRGLRTGGGGSVRRRNCH